VNQTYDLAVVGAGIVGLGHAVDALSRGLRVVVIERDERSVGASVRNFGHVCATAQTGQALEYAWIARQRWLDLGAKAGFDVHQDGTLVVARTEAEAAVLEEFAKRRGPEQVTLDAPWQGDHLRTALLPLDLRLDPRAGIPAIAAWLAGEGVTFHWGTHVGAIEPGVVHTSRGEVRADRIVHAVGHDVDRLFPQIADEHDLVRCRLDMLEVDAAGLRIDPAVLTGTSMLRYGGLAETTAVAAVRAEIEATAPELLARDVNLMLTQRPDGNIVLGDTHDNARTHLPFNDESDYDLLLREGSRLLGTPLTVRRRWRGVYANAPRTDFLVAAPLDGVRVVSVTSGIGMTTGLGLAPAVLDGLL